MNLMTVLTVMFVLNGQPSRVDLVSPTMEQCIQDTFLAQVILNRLGAITVSIACNSRAPSVTE